MTNGAGTWRTLIVAAAVVASASLVFAQAPPAAPVKIFAAGSLQGPMTAIADAVKRDYQITVSLVFGPSGTLRERLEKGEPADLFASANLEHPLALTAAHRSGPTMLFARNALCAFTRPDVAVSSQTLLERMIDPKVKLGTSTPVSDPAGDYTWLMFRKAETLHAGAYATLDRKALKLFGGAALSPAPPAVPQGRNATAFQLENHTVDIYLQYCSGRSAFMRDSPQASVVAFPASLAVGADYGMTLLRNAAPDAATVAAFIMSPAGQRLLADAGFEAVTLPGGEPLQ